MKVTSNIPCKCGFTTLIRFKAPGFMNPTLTSFTCSGCDSRLAVSIRRPADKSLKGKIEFVTKFTWISPILADLLSEAVTPIEVKNHNAESQDVFEGAPL